MFSFNPTQTSVLIVFVVSLGSLSLQSLMDLIEDLVRSVVLEEGEKGVLCDLLRGDVVDVVIVR